LLENGADVLRLTGMGLAQDEATKMELRVRKRGGGDNECYHQCQQSGSKNDDNALGLNWAVLGKIRFAIISQRWTNV
jgi:hypothetical protein